MRKRPRTKAVLAKTFADHRADRSTPPDVLRDNSGKTFTETMSDKELLQYMLIQIAALEEPYEKALEGSELDRRIIEMNLRDFLIPNMGYLRSVGRLPVGLANFDPYAHFAL